MSLSKTEFGDFNLFTIETGDIKLDGGAMFGVVPKTLWSKGIEPDEKNRIPMTMRCLLVQSKSTKKIYLIDNGVGTKFNEKMMEIYQIDFSQKTLLGSLKHHGFTPEDITDVIFTHLHFDHCGGTTYFNKNGDIEFTFPNATYHVNERHWETATTPNAREKASFLRDNIQPLASSTSLNLVPDHHEFEPGLKTLVMNGHTIGQQLPVIESEKGTLVFVADLMPTHVHLPLPWVMGYDMYPTETLLEKKAFVNEASENNWFLFLEHDLFEEVITVKIKEGKYMVNQRLTLFDL
ncbi:MAG: MBL fold metallo-hydrolase [Balneolales bacterium]|nr:MBL fold metallo-hydrolase [Balneolales bacterium]